ncbi:MAG: hypothetical protein ACOVO1_01350, partial [Chitinophagaceae bacterium]
MKKAILIVVVIVASVIVYISYNNKPTQSSDSQSCNCSNTWFPHSQTPNTNDGAGGPFDTDSTSNCMFHQLAVQKFLWLTRTLPNGHPYFQDSLIQVNILLAKPKPQLGLSLVLIDTLQAGSSGTLKSNPAFAANGKTSYMVYYSKFVNDTLYNDCTRFATFLSQSDSLAQRNSNNYEFSNGALETKASWINVDAIKKEEQANYYTTEAAVWVNNSYQKQTVALLGLHVATKVINHPEFIWATFQHHGMAPYHDWTTRDTNTTANNDYLFFAKGTTHDVQGISWFNNQHGKDSVLPTPYQAFSVYKYGTMVTTGGGYIDTTSQGAKGDALNFNNIDAINTSLQSQLKKENDVWSNYMYNGAIWLNTDKKTKEQIDSLIHSFEGTIEINKGAFSRGSLAAMNITMETYRQVFQSLNKTQATFNDVGNCFGCHNGQTMFPYANNVVDTGTSPLYFSHIFNHYLRSYSQTNRDNELPAKKHDNKNDAAAFIKKKQKPQ